MPPAAPTPADVAASVDPIAAALGPLFEKALDYVRERDERRTARHEELDEAEDQRRNNIARSIGTLCSALTEFAVAGAAWFRQQTPTVRDPKQ